MPFEATAVYCYSHNVHVIIYLTYYREMMDKVPNGGGVKERTMSWKAGRPSTRTTSRPCMCCPATICSRVDLPARAHVQKSASAQALLRLLGGPIRQPVLARQLSGTTPSMPVSASPPCQSVMKRLGTGASISLERLSRSATLESSPTAQGVQCGVAAVRRCACVFKVG